MKGKRSMARQLSPMTIEIFEQSRLLISGCVGVTHFSKERIGIRTTSVPVLICGSGLTLCWSGDERLMIRGKIASIEYGGKNEHI